MRTTAFRSITLIAIAAGAFAADGDIPNPITPSVKDSDLKITIGGQLQARAEWSQARTNDDKSFNATNGQADSKSDDVDFYMRRISLKVKGSWHDYGFDLGMRAHNSDRTTNNGTASNAGTRTFEVNTASANRTFKGDGITQKVQLGLDYAFFNSAEFTNSGALLTASNRSTEQLMGVRGTGIGYRVDVPWIYFGADVQNNYRVLNGTGDDANSTNSSYQSEGLCYTSRIEFTPTGDWTIKPKDFRESYAGKAGHGWMMGAEAGFNHHDIETPQGSERARWKNTLVVGAESLLHIDGLTALIENRWVKQVTNTDQGEVTNAASVDNPRYANIFIVQAGYALPCLLIPDAVIEPVARFTRLDYNRASNESTSYGQSTSTSSSSGTSEYALSSGNQYDLGANWYLSGVAQYSNKVSLLYTHWVAEDSGSTAGNVKAKADIVRLQYQFLF